MRPFDPVLVELSDASHWFYFIRGGTMGHVFEIDPLTGHISYARPEQLTVEIQDEAAAVVPVTKEILPLFNQPELNLGMTEVQNASPTHD